MGSNRQLSRQVQLKMLVFTKKQYDFYWNVRRNTCLAFSSKAFSLEVFHEQARSLYPELGRED